MFFQFKTEFFIVPTKIGNVYGLCICYDENLVNSLVFPIFF